ncbi:thiamine pyrophosphate-binding protein [Aquabacter spiritensis]|uniref:Acetolactate synthase-1/2/3 large subunit n=1 Tax=Aquabacter spiritensis TaxID=933073 RepID=A0A4R3LTI5_9HYPH|nr:thiamine pyrophosphate-binding protein [Aquabacter spiritensis]TCT03852.1 acetolactate synthase-1/2/3 large subunit [Aquabacter spiritensis]
MGIRGYELVGRALAQAGADTAFFIMGGPMNDALNCARDHGVRLIDVRHEQAAALMAQAYARMRGTPGLCIGASGPGTINLTTGLANALVDCAPVVALGGASPLTEFGTGSFQEIDQLAIMRPVTKWAERVHETRRIPELIARAFREAMAGRPGPVYLDLPGDVLYGTVEEADVVWPRPLDLRPPAASAEAIASCLALLKAAKRPVLLSGSGILWSGAADRLARFVEATGIPLYTTPQGRGITREDAPGSFPLARSTAYREADLVLVLGTRLSYVFSQGKAPRFSPDATFVMINTDPEAIVSAARVDLGIVGDAGLVVDQLSQAVAGQISPDRFAPWRDRLKAIEDKKKPAAEAELSTDAVPIHPLRLCREIRDIIDPQTILVVDGQEILNYGRQSIPSHLPGHRLNSGPFGTMGVGLPFGVGAKAARPDKTVLVLHGDGSFGLNAMELDTAVRHGLPILVVISLNGGWTADPERTKPGRDLGYTRFDRMAEALGCHGEFVERPEDIRPALERGAAEVARGRTAVVNVVTDWRARAGTVSFTAHST